MDPSTLKNKNLPDSPGVYFFKDGKGNILYIGKAASLRDRVRSYFSGDIREARGALIEQMTERAVDVDFIETDSVLEALILEARKIKEHQPPYNVKEKDDKSFNYVVFTNESFPKVIIVREKDLNTSFSSKDIKYAFGPFPHASAIKEALRIIRKIFPFRDEKCTPYDEVKNKEKVRPCFSRQIGLCPGTCTGEITKKEYSRRIQHLKLLFEGKKKTLIRKLEKEMNEYAGREKFEEAEEVKRKINKLSHIQDVSLLKKEDDKYGGSGRRSSEDKNISGWSSDTLSNSFRIEAYDVAHTSGKQSVGAMVVWEDGELKKSEYKKFQIKEAEKGDDIAALKEILERRLKHTEWKHPNLIVVDGGKNQKNAVVDVLDNYEIDIAVVSVVKDEKHKPKQLLGESEIKNNFEEQILLANSEAHRFAISYHRQKRGKLNR